ncbi:MAG: hypothetical protein ACFFFG_06065 [Candidatus Thorarchaeota archaeon]
MKKIGLLVIFSLLLGMTLIPVSGNQISIIGGATTTTPSQQSVFIPAGDYHVFIEANGSAGSYVAYVSASNNTATLFTWTSSPDGLSSLQDTWTGQITFSSSNTLNFTFEIQTIYANSYEVTFQIVFTDMVVATITKTGVVSDASYGIEIIGLVLIGLTLVLIRKRRVERD